MAQMKERLNSQPTPEAQPFWDAVRCHELRLPRCRACGQLHYRPRTFCSACLSRDLEWVRCSGRGKLYSYVINHRPAQGFVQEAFAITAVVELEEGPRLMGTMTDVGLDRRRLRVNMPVEIHFQDVEEGLTMFTFQPA